MSAEKKDARCSCDPVPMSCGGEGPSEACEIHGRPYAEWVERGDILNARLEAVRAVIAKAHRTPHANDPYHVAKDIADDLEAAVYLDALPNHATVDPIAEGRAAAVIERIGATLSDWTRGLDADGIRGPEREPFDRLIGHIRADLTRPLPPAKPEATS